MDQQLRHEIEAAECDWHWVFPTVKTCCSKVFTPVGCKGCLDPDVICQWGFPFRNFVVIGSFYVLLTYAMLLSSPGRWQQVFKG